MKELILLVLVTIGLMGCATASRKTSSAETQNGRPAGHDASSGAAERNHSRL